MPDIEEIERRLRVLAEQVSRNEALLLKHARRHDAQTAADPLTITSSAHARQHALQSAADHTGTISSTQHGTIAAGDLHTEYQKESLLTTLGDMIYATAASVWARLAGNITTTKKFLTQTGDGAASAAPTWGTIEDADIPAAIARDTEVTAAMDAHKDLDTGVHGAGASTLATEADIATHAAAGDPHTGYQKESEKGAASGYMGLDASGYGNSPPKGHDHTAAGDGGVLTNEAHDGYSEFAASADPAAPAGTIVRLYNSAGKIYARTATAFDGPIHAQYHEIVDDVHATTAWKMWYSAADGKINEITLGADGQVLTSAGPAAPPVFEDAAGGISQAQVLARVSLRG